MGEWATALPAWLGNIQWSWSGNTTTNYSYSTVKKYLSTAIWNINYSTVQSSLSSELLISGWKWGSHSTVVVELCSTVLWGCFVVVFCCKWLDKVLKNHVYMYGDVCMCRSRKYSVSWAKSHSGNKTWSWSLNFNMCTSSFWKFYLT